MTAMPRQCMIPTLKSIAGKNGELMIDPSVIPTLLTPALRAALGGIISATLTY